MNIPHGEGMPVSMEHMDATVASPSLHDDIEAELTNLLPYAQNRTNLYEGVFTTDAMPSMSLEVTITVCQGKQNSTSVNMLPVYLGLVSLQGLEAIISEDLSDTGTEERVLVVPNGDNASGGEAFYEMLANTEDESLPESLQDFASLVHAAINHDIGDAVEEGVMSIGADSFESIFSGLTYAVMDQGEDVEFMTEGVFVDPAGRKVTVQNQGTMRGDGSHHELRESSLGEDSPIVYVERAGDFRYMVLPFGESYRILFSELDADSKEVLPEITDEMRSASGVTVVEIPETVEDEDEPVVTYAFCYRGDYHGNYATREKAQSEADRFYASLLADQAGERTLTITRAMRVRAVLHSLRART